MLHSEIIESSGEREGGGHIILECLTVIDLVLWDYDINWLIESTMLKAIVIIWEYLERLDYYNSLLIYCYNYIMFHYIRIYVVNR